ncbi:MAG: translation initiation factor [Bacteroidetes bacterium]|nr:translation initiation factor [Bacteroidota bacterium]
MSKPKKIKRDTDGIVYSTEPNFAFENLFEKLDLDNALKPNQQKLNIRMENKGRGGKTATLIEGFHGSEEELKDLEKKLKTHCGTGGSIVDGEILIQGDQRKKVMDFLQKLGYKTNKAI